MARRRLKFLRFCVELNEFGEARIEFRDPKIAQRIPGILPWKTCPWSSTQILPLKTALKGLTLIPGKLSKVWMIFAHQNILKNVVYFLKIELCFHIWSATDNGLLDLRNSSRKLYHSPSDFEMVIPPYTTSLWGPQRPFIFYRIKKSTSKCFAPF